MEAGRSLQSRLRKSEKKRKRVEREGRKGPQIDLKLDCLETGGWCLRFRSSFCPRLRMTSEHQTAASLGLSTSGEEEKDRVSLPDWIRSDDLRRRTLSRPLFSAFFFSRDAAVVVNLTPLNRPYHVVYRCHAPLPLASLDETSTHIRPAPHKASRQQAFLHRQSDAEGC